MVFMVIHDKEYEIVNIKVAFSKFGRDLFGVGLGTKTFLISILLTDIFSMDIISGCSFNCFQHYFRFKI